MSLPVYSLGPPAYPLPKAGYYLVCASLSALLKVILCPAVHCGPLSASLMLISYCGAKRVLEGHTVLDLLLFFLTLCPAFFQLPID